VRSGELSLVALRALFCIELIGGHTKDIVALGANAVDETPGGPAGRYRILFFDFYDLRRSVGGLIHGGILSCVPRPPDGIPAHPGRRQKVQPPAGSV
jgi:hypothetical protein